jgi:hypothetical protein
MPLQEKRSDHRFFMAGKPFAPTGLDAYSAACKDPRCRASAFIAARAAQSPPRMAPVKPPPPVKADAK